MSAKKMVTAAACLAALVAPFGSVANKAGSNTLGEDQQKAQEMFAAHFDFTRAVHALVPERLVEQGFAELVEMDGQALAYSIEFDQPYVDVYGNVYSGRLTYSELHADEQLGNQKQMTFDDFAINGIKVRGAKKSESCAVQDREIRRGCWGVGRIAGVSYSQEPLTFTMPTGEEMVFRSALTKDIVYNELSGQKSAKIGGVAEVDVNGKTFTFEVNEALAMSGNCRWLEAGSVSVAVGGATTAAMDFSTHNCASTYQLSFANGETQQVARYHSYWK